MNTNPESLGSHSKAGGDLLNTKTNSETIAVVDTNHEGMINDTQFDFFGTRIASCDSMGHVRITKMQGNIVDEQSTSFLIDIDSHIQTAH